jgi:hypothetical protein
MIVMARKIKSRGARLDGRANNMPPVEHRFKPKQSGNRKGRPKGMKNQNTILTEQFKRTIEVRENGTVRRISQLEALFLRLWQNAFAGKKWATELLLELYADLATSPKPLPEITSDMDAQRLLRIYQEALRRDPPGGRWKK